MDTLTDREQKQLASDVDEVAPLPWFADDFETTTDLDGPPTPYRLTPEEADALGDLSPGDSRLTIGYTPAVGMWTVTAVRADDGTLTATRRTGRVRVWSWAIAPLDGDAIHAGTSLREYVELAAELGGIHWFHNLRFDGAFLDAYLVDEAPHGIALGVVDAQPHRVPSGYMGALISDQGAHYARYIHLGDGRRFECRDSLKKFPGTSLAQLADMYGAETAKGSIDYTAERPAGYQPTREEWEYIRTDVAILRTALRTVQAIGNTALTIGGDAMREYRRTMTAGRYRQVFPLLSRDLDDWIRRAYRGGWTYVNPRWQRLVIGRRRLARTIYEQLGPQPGITPTTTFGSVWDVNSMYPAVMRQSSYPIGEPVSLAPGQTELEGYPHVVYGAVLTARIKPGRLPMIQVKRDARYNPVDYQLDVDGVEWYGTDVDWKLLYEQYDVIIHEWIAGFAFAGAVGLFDAYIDHWMAVKAEADAVMTIEREAGRVNSSAYRQAKGQRAQSKFQLNNLWGRFAINPMRAGRLPSIGPDGAVHYNTLPAEYGQPAYTPVGIWTTSYGRDRVIRAAQNFGDRFLAADTDSCHVLGTDPGDLVVHPSELGAWKREAVFDRATYLRAKAYAEQVVDGSERTVEAHVAGLPRKLLDGARVEDIVVGTKYSGKLVPRRVPGGVILVSTDFEIGERDAWGHRS